MNGINRLLSLLLAVSLLLTTAPAALAAAPAEDVSAGRPAVTAEQEAPGQAARYGVARPAPAPRQAAPRAGAYTISLAAGSFRLEVGATQALTAAVAPGGAVPDGMTVRWVSSDPAEVSVTPVGGNPLRATLEGLQLPATNDPIQEVTITVQLWDGPAGSGSLVDDAQCQVTVYSNQTRQLVITPASTELNPGDTATLYGEITPASSDEDPITWTSENPELVTVEAGTGRITAGQTPGTATIVAASESGLTARATVTVRGIALRPEDEPLELQENRNGLLEVVAYGEALQDAEVRWSSSQPSVVRVENGYLYPVSVGEAVITVSTTVNSRAYSAAKTVRVVRNTADPVTASADAGEPLSFAGAISSGIAAECQDVLGSPLRYVTGLRVATSQGTLYYRYRSEADTGAGVGSNENYYVNPTAAQAALADVTFVPRYDFGGTAVISYTGYAASGQFFQGTIEVTVRAVSGITYTVAADQAVQFNADDFNRICAQQTGRNLSYVTFSLPSASRGTLYYRYLSPSNPGTEVSSSEQYRRTGTPSLSDVYFVPATGRTGTVQVSYTGYNVQNASFRGQITIRITEATSGRGDLTYTLAQGGRLTFDDDDFNDLCRGTTGSSLDYVRFELPASRMGTLYYNYTSGGGYDSRVSEGRNYYRSSSPYLRRVAFVADEDFTGDATIPFTAWDIRGNTFSGTILIRVGESGSGDVRYSCSRNGSVEFDDNDFNALCRQETGSTLSYIRFDELPSSSRGTLYYNYDNGDYDSRVSTSRSYYRSASPYLDRVTFVPASGFTGTVSIPFTGRSTGGDSFTGTVEIGVDTEENRIRYQVRSGGWVEMDDDDFDDLCQDLTGERLRSVQFQLPASSRGTLYYDYDSGGYDSRVSASRSYYRTSSPYLNRVAFVPASGYTGTVSVNFTGRSTGGRTFDGVVEITVETTTAVSAIVYRTEYQPVQFRASDFRNACEALGMGTLSYVRFTQPSTGAGRLCYPYRSDSDPGSDVSSGTSYYPGRTPSIADVAFVPRVGYSGTVTIRYTGYNSSGASFQGQVQVQVQPRTTSRYFTDLNTVPWAVTAVDYLYERGVVVGVGGSRFGPQSQITRGDFVLMLMRAFSLSGSGGSGFRDVPASSYYAQAISAAQALGIAGGYPDGTFRPEDPITRQEAVVLLQRTMQAAGWSMGEGNADVLSAYPDGGAVSAYARSAMALMTQYGIISGSTGGYLQPLDAITRAETSVMLARAMTL